MPRGVYPRKKKDGNVSTASTTASKTTTAKKYGKRASNVSQSVSGGDIGISSQFNELQKYLTTLVSARGALPTSMPELESELKATISSLKTFRETHFTIQTQQETQQRGNATQAQVQAAPVPFNPPAYSTPSQA
jgi:hypothetical protein